MSQREQPLSWQAHEDDQHSHTSAQHPLAHAPSPDHKFCSPQGSDRDHRSRSNRTSESDVKLTSSTRSKERTSNSKPAVRSRSMVRYTKKSKELELVGLLEDLEKENRKIEELKEKERILDEQIRDATEAVINLKTVTPKDLEKRLDETTRELTVTERFLSSADIISEAEITRMVETINDEILQLSSVVADMVPITTKKYSIHRENIAHFKPLAIQSLGNAFLDMVMPKQLQDTTAIQIGWQGILVQRCTKLIEEWTIGRYAWSNDSWSHAYGKIYETYDQTVAARWRAITVGALRKISPPETELWIQESIKHLLALPIVCGYIPGVEEYQSISTAFHQRMGPLVDKCLELNRVIFEGVVSTDIRPYLFEAGAHYNPEMADLDYEDEEDEELQKGEQKGGKVACSLAIGLFRSRKIKKPDDHTKFVMKDETIKKTKVILLTTLQSLLS